MALTPEQKAAHEELDAAIRKVLSFQGVREGGPPPNLVDWIVVTEGISFDENGDSIGWHNMIFRGGQVRRSVALGLLEIGSDLMIPQEEED